MLPINRLAASTLRTAAAVRPAFSNQIPRAVRWQSTKTSSSEEASTSSPSEPPSPVHLTKGEVSADQTAAGSAATPRHAPDYNAVIDYRTS